MISSTIVRAVLATILLLAFTHAGAAQSKIYKTVDEHGNVVFTDIPPRDNETGEQIIVENPNSFATDEALGPREQWIVDEEDGTSALEDAPFSYQSLEIKFPQPDEPVRENAGNITIVAVANPRLQLDHRMRLLMDGQPVQEGRQSQFSLENVDRGTHTIATEILDGRGNILIRSPASTFHMLRVAAARKQPRS